MTTKASQSLRSDVWTDFGFSCKSGTQEIDKVGWYKSITVTQRNLRNHLTRHHADALQQPAAKPVDSKQTQLDKAFVCKLLPTSVITPLRARLLEEMQPAQDDSVMVKEMKSAVRQDLQKRYLFYILNHHDIVRPVLFSFYYMTKKYFYKNFIIM